MSAIGLPEALNDFKPRATRTIVAWLHTAPSGDNDSGEHFVGEVEDISYDLETNSISILFDRIARVEANCRKGIGEHRWFPIRGSMGKNTTVKMNSLRVGKLSDDELEIFEGGSPEENGSRNGKGCDRLVLFNCAQRVLEAQMIIELSH